MEGSRKRPGEKKSLRNEIEMDETSEYFGLSKREIEMRKKMAGRFGRKPTHLHPDTIEERKEQPQNRVNAPDGLGMIGRIQSH